MVTTHHILAEVTAGISELKKNPMAVVGQGDGVPVAILNHNAPAFYVIPASTFERMYDIIEDAQLRAVVEERKNQPEIRIDIDAL